MVAHIFIDNLPLTILMITRSPWPIGLLAACEQVVVRSMPVTSITREKRVPASQHPGPMDQWLNEGLQIRSNTFQARFSKLYVCAVALEYTFSKAESNWASSFGVYLLNGYWWWVETVIRKRWCIKNLSFHTKDTLRFLENVRFPTVFLLLKILSFHILMCWIFAAHQSGLRWGSSSG